MTRGEEMGVIRFALHIGLKREIGTKLSFRKKNDFRFDSRRFVIEVKEEMNWSRKEGNFGTSLKHVWRFR